MKKIVVIGTGGHAKVVIDIINAMIDCEIIGVTSKELPVGSRFCDYLILGDDSVLQLMYIEKKFDELAMGVGGFRDNNLRTKIFTNLKLEGFKFTNVIHPNAYISDTVEMGEGCVIFPGVLLNTEVKIGNNTIIATGASVDHETVIGNNSLVSAGAIIGANVKIMDNALIALGANVISGISIGHNALVGAGAVVIKNIEDNSTYVGNPARKIK
jgi:UDP-perosamine 4-acetyltransferase